MSESDIIRVQYEALKKFCKGDRHLVMKVINEFAPAMREYFKDKQSTQVSPDELCSLIESKTQHWQK
jgi:hypothetical protein